jgi:hypothetical protein
MLPPHRKHFTVVRHNMNLRLITIILILAFSCKAKTDNWRTLDFGDFKLKTPPDWKKFKEQGIDAYIGGLTNDKDSLWFYYGWYISGPKDDETSSQLYGQDTINGFSSIIIIPFSRLPSQLSLIHSFFLNRRRL